MKIIPMNHGSQGQTRTRIWPAWILFVLILGLAPASLPAHADQAGAPPAKTGAAADSDDIGQYLADHQTDLEPFFEKNSDDLVKGGVPVILNLLAWIMFFTLLVGWLLDVFGGRVFSAFFAPAYSKMKRALIYATGSLVLSVVLTVLMSITILYGLNLPHFQAIIAVVVGIFVLISLVIQVGWICYLYQTNIVTSLLFYLVVMAVHSFAASLVTIPVLGAKSSSSITSYFDNVLTPKLQAEIDARKHELSAVKEARDEAKSKVDAAQNQIAQAQAEQAKLKQLIEANKNSETYVFSQIAKLHSQGDLNGALNALTNFIAKFPNGSLIDPAKAELAQVNSEIAIKAEQEKEAEAKALLDAAQARAALLARAGQGEVTLSEMRQAIYGKTRADVSDLFGPPTETASDRWGYGQKMILNPMTGEKFGLAIVFADGTVQSVDYYYGSPK